MRLIKHKFIPFILIIIILLSGCGIGLTSKNKDFLEFKYPQLNFTISYPRNWFVNDSSLGNQINVIISKEKMDITKQNTVFVFVVGGKGNSGKQMYQDYIDKFNKEAAKGEEFVVNKKIKGKKYSLEDGHFILFEYKEKYFIILYDGMDENNINNAESIIKTIIIK